MWNPSFSAESGRQAETCDARSTGHGDLHADFAGQDVPDPYYGGAAGFERVLDMTEQISQALLAKLRAEA